MRHYPSLWSLRKITKPERQRQAEEAEGESFMQYVLLPKNNYNTSIYRQGLIYNFWDII